MKNWKSALLLLALLPPLFYALHYFGFLVSKSGSFYGGASGTPTRFQGEFRHLCGTVSKRFRIAGKYAALSIHLEAVSGSASVEVLLPGGVPLYSRHFCSTLAEQVSCREIPACTVRITSEDFAGKFLISLE